MIPSARYTTIRVPVAPRSVTSATVQPIPEPIVFPLGSGKPPEACAVAVGNFDGVHAGHAVIAARLRLAAGRLGLPAVALTFDPHPASVLRPDRAPVPLTTPGRRAELLLELGIDAVCVQPADAALMAVEAEEFYAEVLRGRFGARAVVEGQDFRFGARRAGDVAMLERLCRSDGVELEVVAPLVVDGEPVSSSRLRRLIDAGRVGEARSLMTAAYRLTGVVTTGARRGATIGFPTANLTDIATLLPALGVYAARVQVDGDVFASAVHVGPNVTFGETRVSVEAHLIGFSGDLYGMTLDVDFLDRVRDTRHFASVDELTSQLAADVAAAARIVATDPIPNRKT